MGEWWYVIFGWIDKPFVFQSWLLFIFHRKDGKPRLGVFILRFPLLT
jgi:hypothetical protein